MKTKTVTLDTNVWLSIALAIASGRSSSPALALFRAIRVGRIKAVISDAALYELGDVLSRITFQLEPTFIVDFLDLVDAICGHVATRGLDMGCRDDADDKIVFDRFHVASHACKAVDTVRKQEHRALFASIRSGSPINNGLYMARSTMLAIMGRMVTYTGQTLTWDECLASSENLSPPKYEWGSVSVPPGAVVTKLVSGPALSVFQKPSVRAPP